MIVQVDGKTIEISEELIHKLFDSAIGDIEKKYFGLDTHVRLGIKTAIRTFVFPNLEKLLKIPIRPNKEVDPLMFLIYQFILFVEEASKHASVKITTEPHGTSHRPTAFGLTFEDSSEGGRQLDFSWKEG